MGGAWGGCNVLITYLLEVKKTCTAFLKSRCAYTWWTFPVQSQSGLFSSALPKQDGEDLPCVSLLRKGHLGLFFLVMYNLPTFFLQLQLNCLLWFPWFLVIFLLPWSPAQIVVNLLQGIFCLIPCNSGHRMTNQSFSFLQKIIVLEGGMIITLCSFLIAQTLWRAASLGWEDNFLS